MGVSAGGARFHPTPTCNTVSELSEARAAIQAEKSLPWDRRKRNGRRQKSFEELHGRLDTSRYEAEYGAVESEDNSIFGGWFLLFWLGN